MIPDGNPYSPPVAMPTASMADRDAAWYLDRVQAYYRRMGILMLIYIFIVFPLVAVDTVLFGAVGFWEMAAPLVCSFFLIWLFVTMTKIGYLSPDEFPSHYKKARWVGIIAGALFLPIIGVPAFISIRRLTRYDALVNSKRSDESGILTLDPSD